MKSRDFACLCSIGQSQTEMQRKRQRQEQGRLRQRSIPVSCSTEYIICLVGSDIMDLCPIDQRSRESFKINEEEII
jgi:hypothetical protein